MLSKDAASNLKDVSTTKKEMFHDLYVEFVGQNISAIVAKEYYFHETCRCLVLKKLPKKSTSTKPTAFATLKNYVPSNIIERGEIIKMNNLTDIYKELISENDEEESGLRASNLKRLENHFGEKLSFWAPKGKSGIVYNEEKQCQGKSLYQKDKENLVEDCAKIIKKKYEKKFQRFQSRF